VTYNPKTKQKQKKKKTKNQTKKHKPMAANDLK
jgi:hypothetical protein